MRFFKRLFVLLLIGLIGTTVWAVFSMVDDQPEVAADTLLSSNDLAQAEVFLRNADPRELEPGTVTAFTINERDLELIIGYGLSQLEGGGAAVSLQQGLADLHISARLPDNPLGEYVNVNLTVSQVGRALAVEQLRVGGVTIPGVFADTVLAEAHKRLQEVPEYVAVLDAINGYTIGNDRLNVVYQWQPEVLSQLSECGRSLLISEADQQRLVSHASNLASITNDPRLPNEVSLAELLEPAFLFAKVRGEDPIAENRAAILSLAMYVLGISVPRVLGLPENAVPEMGRRQVVLSERHDFAQHFLVSAALQVSAGTGLADTIGLLKELDDSDGGSGFSFTDIGADRTGVRFAELAVGSVQSARSVQDRLSFGVEEGDFMAEFRDLPEFMDAATFASIYGGVGTPRYNAVINDIESRIASVRMFREATTP